MLNHLYFLDFTGKRFAPYVAARQECQQYLHLASISRTTGERKIAKNLFHKAHTIAARYELTREKVQALEELYAIMSLNCQPHVFDQLIEELNETRKLYLKEEEARELFYRFRMLLVKSVNSRKKNIDEVVGVIEKLASIWKETDSANVFNYYYTMRLFYMEMTGQFSEAIPFLSEILTDKFQGKKLNTRRLDKSHLIYSLQYAFLRTKQFEKGFEISNKINELVDPNDNNWFAFKSQHFHLAMHSKSYKMAFDIINEVFENKKFITLNKRMEEEWKLNNAYLHFAYAGNFFMRSFNFAKFVEEMPHYSKDKEGYNVAILILQFLFYVERGDIDSLVYRRDALKKYMDNHFKENFSYRTRTFFKLLNIVVENSLDSKKISQKSKYLLNKLNENQIVGSAHQEVEIIPYEHLWDLLMNMIRHEKVNVH